MFCSIMPIRGEFYEKRKYKRIKEISKIKIDNTKIYFARISPVAPHIVVLTTDLIAV